MSYNYNSIKILTNKNELIGHFITYYIIIKLVP